MHPRCRGPDLFHMKAGSALFRFEEKKMKQDLCQLCRRSYNSNAAINVSVAVYNSEARMDMSSIFWHPRTQE